MLKNVLSIGMGILFILVLGTNIYGQSDSTLTPQKDLTTKELGRIHKIIQNNADRKIQIQHLEESNVLYQRAIAEQFRIQATKDSLNQVKIDKVSFQLSKANQEKRILKIGLIGVGILTLLNMIF